MRQVQYLLITLLVFTSTKATPLAESEEWKSVHEMTMKAYGDWRERLYSNNLPLSRQSRFAFSYLPPQDGFLDKQIALGRKIKEHFKDIPLAANQHDPLWGQWAQLLLDITDVGLIEKMCASPLFGYVHTDKRRFQEELNERVKNLDTPYSWFSLFAIRLTYLSNSASSKVVESNFNTGITDYVYGLLQGDLRTFLWHDHKKTLEYFTNTGDLKTRTELSPLVHIQEFPEVIITPYPFSLSIVEMAVNRTCATQPSWFAAFCQYVCRADGGELGQPLAYMHDLQHLAYNGLKSKTIAFVAGQDDLHYFQSPQNLLEFQTFIKEAREVGEKIFTSMAQYISRISEPNRQKMDAFWLFLNDHEGLEYVLIALSYLFLDSLGLGKNDIDFRLNGFHQGTYYLSEMTGEIQNMSLEERVRALGEDFDRFKKQLMIDTPKEDLDRVKGIFDMMLSIKKKMLQTLGKNILFCPSGMLPYTTAFSNLSTLRDGVMYYNDVSFYKSPSIILNPENERCKVALVQKQAH